MLLRTRWLLSQLGQGLLHLHKVARTLPSSARASADDKVARARLAKWTACLQVRCFWHSALPTLRSIAWLHNQHALPDMLAPQQPLCMVHVAAAACSAEHSTSRGVRAQLVTLSCAMQAAVHAIACFDAHLHDTAVEGAYRDFTRDAALAPDLLHLARRHDRFAHECARACTLADDGTLATAVMGVTEACTAAARLTHDELLRDERGPRRGQCGALVHKLVHERTWERMDAALGGVKQRVEYLQKRLRYRAARGLFEAWYAAMTYKCL